MLTQHTRRRSRWDRKSILVLAACICGGWYWYSVHQRRASLARSGDDGLDREHLQLRLHPTATPSSAGSSVASAQALVGGTVHEKVTVIVTSFRSSGFRPLWLHAILSIYCDVSMQDLVDRVLLIWNNPEQAPPQHLPSCVIIHQAPYNSLNHRWVASLPYIRTEAILNLDDDISVSKVGQLAATCPVLP
jgi:hypothetical protein